MAKPHALVTFVTYTICFVTLLSADTLVLELTLFYRIQVALAEKASLTASVSGSQHGDDVASDWSDVDTMSRRVPTPRATRRDRDLPSVGVKDRKDEQIRNLENQVEHCEVLMLCE